MTRDTNKPPSEIAQSGASAGEVLGWDGSQWAPKTDATGSGGYVTNGIYYGDGDYSGYDITGSGDASTVQSAIDDTGRNGRALDLPDPEFNYDWDQRVDVPAAERGFTVTTRGFPTLEIPSAFSDNHAWFKPQSTASNDSISGYYMGRMEFEDPDGILDPAISVLDIKQSKFEFMLADCPLIEVIGENGTANQVVIQNAMMKGGALNGNRGAGIRMLEGSGGASTAADQNWVVNTFFNDNVSFSHTAYRDEGRQNNWLNIRCEGAHTICDFPKADDYKVFSGGWDRGGDYANTIKEGPTSEGGTIILQRAANFGSMVLHSPTTTVRSKGDFYTQTDQKGQVRDLLKPLQMLTAARSLPSMGFRPANDSNSGGTISKTASFSDHVMLELDAGTNTGDYAQLDMGDDNFKQQAFPKGAISVRHPGSAESYVLRVGIVNEVSGPTNRVEWIYDPDGDITAGGDEWYFEVENGTVSQSNASGIGKGGGNGGGEGDVVSFGVTEDAGAGSTTYYGNVNGNGAQSVGASGDNFGQASFRVKLRTLDGGNQGVDIRGRDDMRLLTT